MYDRFAGGRAFPILTQVDQCTRECLVRHADHRRNGSKVAAALDAVVAERGAPESIRADKGSEFQSRALDAWAYGHAVRLAFIAPGQPAENGHIESFHGRLRDEGLDPAVCDHLADARRHLAAWKTGDNEVRPHSSLADRTPAELRAAWSRSPFALSSVPTAPDASRPGCAEAGRAAPALDRPHPAPSETKYEGEGQPRRAALAGGA